MPQSSKDRWNAAHYKQMKFSTPPQVATQFKLTCESQNLSMASVIVNFMCDYTGLSSISHKDSQKMKLHTGTRKLRRKEMLFIIDTVTSIYNAEAGTLDKIPENFRETDAYVNTEEIVEALETALESLKNVYSD
jgi:hypothetical protein